MTAMIDSLAAKLSKETGTKFTIYRGKCPKTGRLLYALSAQRKGMEKPYMFWSKGVTRSALTLSLATILDLLLMGFIPHGAAFDHLSAMSQDELPPEGHRA